ncbi:adhesion G-protein coupled receptor G5-like isoform X1 [Pygocentrus nattereri]|uniref:adhesion G-protein coupled receptor G5-like isoform X1 n=1 Tax=Pygocentrus nattereri TaxID=42514 RepID=UPI0008149CCE|nr:adhesion G-protein coupled receptor G5-like isoform X1 [Pygocentrus nattereri]
MNSILITALVITGFSGGYGGNTSTPCLNGFTSKLSYIQNNSFFTMNITDHSRTNIIISDSATKLDCSWGIFQCYIQCGFLNVTKNLSSLLEETICVQNNEGTQLDFILSESGTSCNVTLCNENSVIRLIHGICNVKSTEKELKRLLIIKNMCALVLFNSNNITKSYIRIEKNCIHGIIRIPFEGDSEDFDLEDLALTVVSMNKSTTNSDFVTISTSQVSDYLLPVTTMIPVAPFQNVPEEQSKVAVVIYSSAKQFMINQPNMTILSPVIRIEVVNRHITNLAKPLSINFKLNSNSAVPANFCLSCQYYDDDIYEWKGQQCLIPQNFDSNIANCLYDHMTPFAVLLVDVKIDKSHWKILSYLSYIGCGISAFFSLAAILVFFMKRTPTADSSNSIHVSLSASLLLLNTSFLFSEWAASWSIEGVCVFVAVMIDYSLLCCFSWMAIEALHVYLLLIKVFNTYIRYYMVKLSLFGWGLPALFVGASLSVYKLEAFYGTKKVTLTDSTDTTAICWITNVYFLYGMNITYYSIVFLTNTAVLSTVTSQICKLRRLGAKGKKIPTCKDISTVLGLTCLLGLTWGLAFVTSGYTNYPILYLFCICNSLQGLFMFLWVYLTMRKNRRVAETLSPSDPYSSTSKPKTIRSNDISHYS